MNRRKVTARAVLLASALIIASSCAPHGNDLLLSVPPSTAADNDIYVADAAGRIHALRPDGTEQWTYSLSEDLARQSGEVPPDIRIDYLTARSGGQLFGLAVLATGSHAGERILFALGGKRLLWQRAVEYPAQGIPPIAIGQDAVYEAGNNGTLYAFARADGHPLWQYQVSGGALGTPAIGADHTIYVAGPRHNLHAISPDGSQRWVIKMEP